MAEFWVVVDRACSAELGLIRQCSRLASEKGLSLCAVLIAEVAEPAFCAEAASLGVTRLYHLPLAPVLINEASARESFLSLCRDVQLEAVIFACTQFLSNLAAAVAVKQGRGITADCTALEWSTAHGLLQIRPAYGGRMLAVNRSIQRPYLATVRRGSFPSPEKPEPGICPITVVEIKRQKLRISLEGFQEKAAETLTLDNEDVILSGGLGLGSRENYMKLAQLAALTGAGLGASRAAVAAGYASYNRQVGQTGVPIRPKLYVAFGISGAVQHLSGILGAQKIVAVNSDPKAPIHNFSDLSILADCNTVIDRLIESFQSI